MGQTFNADTIRTLLDAHELLERDTPSKADIRKADGHLLSVLNDLEERRKTHADAMRERARAKRATMGGATV